MPNVAHLLQSFSSFAVPETTLQHSELGLKGDFKDGERLFLAFTFAIRISL
jgi:hypothetical protein